MKLGCLGSADVERSYQPRLIASAIVPDNPSTTRAILALPRIVYAVYRNGSTPFLNVKEQTTTEYPANGSSNLARFECLKRIMVKPHGSLVPVSLTHYC